MIKNTTQSLPVYKTYELIEKSNESGNHLHYRLEKKCNEMLNEGYEYVSYVPTTNEKGHNTFVLLFKLIQ